MDSNTIILVLCLLVIVSYLFEIFARRTGIPAVLMLIILGAGLNMVSEYFNTPSIDYLKLIPVIGTVGLILIVFEGALEIEYHSEKKRLFFKVLLVSVILLGLTSVIMTLMFRHISGLDFY